MCRATAAPDLHLVHLGTRVFTFGDDESPCSGQTLWCNDSEDQTAGVAWDWVELRKGVVAMSDPFGMVTNLQLTDADGEVLNPTNLSVHLNQLVQSLPWQTEVVRAIRSPSKRVALTVHSSSLVQ